MLPSLMIKTAVTLAFVDLCARDLAGATGTEWDSASPIDFSVRTEPKPLNIPGLSSIGTGRTKEVMGPIIAVAV